LAVRRDRPEALLLDAVVAAETVELVREVRAAGRAVGVAQPTGSGSDAGGFDVVVDAGAVGAAKPSREFFTAACQALGQPPGRCLFVDPDDRNVRGARAAGLSAYRWSGPDGIRYLRAVLGLPPAT
jgi:putative hydrolase of the HAD superfamily